MTVLVMLAAACSPRTDVVAIRAVNGVPAAPINPTVPNGTIAFSPCRDIADSFIPEISDPPDGVPEEQIKDWECGYLTVPVDPTDPAGDTIQLAVTRRVGATSNGRALFVNPGGPGGSGVQTAWGFWDVLPADVQSGYDIVGWDPRGIWASIPRIQCPPDTRWDDYDFFDKCATEWGPLPGHMSTANTVADLEALRVAFGQTRLNYLGYSYGTFVGALYARDYPDKVGRFILDGSVSPDAATPETPTPKGDAFYADGDPDLALDRFSELCTASSYCSVADSPSETIGQIASHADELTVTDFPDNPELTADEVWQTVDAVVEFPNAWPLLAASLERAVDGDGTRLAALAVEFDTDDEDSEFVLDSDNHPVANLTIYCADYAEVRSRGGWCEGDIPNQLLDGTITPVDVETPILVIGNEYDPITPLAHAYEMRDRLGDAVVVQWNGVGHTAFPDNSRCIDDVVSAYLVDGAVPKDSLVCPFVDGFADSDSKAIGDYYFHLTPQWLASIVDQTLADDGVENAGCLADKIVADDADAAVDIALNVSSDASSGALDAAHADCD